MAELTVCGAGSQWDQPLTPAHEVALIQQNSWSPGLKDFEAISPRNAVACKFFDQVIGLIMQQPDKSVSRLNIVTHGNDRIIAFSGTMKQKITGGVEVFLTINNGPGLVALDRHAITALNSGSTFILPGGKSFTIDDVRKKFRPPNPAIFIYSCNSGSNPFFVQDIADTFQVMVNGFKKKIAFCPTFTQTPPRVVKRNSINLGRCKSDNVDNFYKLVTAARGHWVTKKHSSWKPLRP